jgi:hypothetical protein
MTTPDARSDDPYGLQDQLPVYRPILDDFGRPVEMATVTPRSYGPDLLIAAAVTSSVVSVCVGVMHAVSKNGFFRLGYLGGVGLGVVALTWGLTSAGEAAFHRGSYSRRRSRWMGIGVATAAVLGLVGFILSVPAGDFSAD